MIIFANKKKIELDRNMDLDPVLWFKLNYGNSELN